MKPIISSEALFEQASTICIMLPAMQLNLIMQYCMESMETVGDKYEISRKYTDRLF